jgi:purine-binding chemotaxis protein CheW
MSSTSLTEVRGTVMTVANGSAQGIFVTLSVGGQMFGIPVLQVRDILGPQKITHVPLAPPEVLGSLNLRGRIVTAIDVRVRLGLSPQSDDSPSMSIVVDYDEELYSLVVDKIGEVISLSSEIYEKNPATLDAHWQDVSNGIYRLKDCLLVVLDVARLLRFDHAKAA